MSQGGAIELLHETEDELRKERARRRLAEQCLSDIRRKLANVPSSAVPDLVGFAVELSGIVTEYDLVNRLHNDYPVRSGSPSTRG